jgi:hypothetical protein
MIIIKETINKENSMDYMYEGRVINISLAQLKAINAKNRKLSDELREAKLLPSNSSNQFGKWTGGSSVHDVKDSKVIRTFTNDCQVNAVIETRFQEHLRREFHTA